MLNPRDAILCELLVLRCRRRDLAAARELTEMFQRPLLYYVRRIVESESEAHDVLQETWVSVFGSLGRLRDARTLPAFIYRIARNAALAQLRKKQADGRLMESYAADAQAADDAEPDGFSEEEAARVHAGLVRLPLAHREVLTLYFLRSLSIAEIAEVVAAPEGTVKSRLFHAKKGLRAILEKGGVS